MENAFNHENIITILEFLEKYNETYDLFEYSLIDIYLSKINVEFENNQMTNCFYKMIMYFNNFTAINNNIIDLYDYIMGDDILNLPEFETERLVIINDIHVYYSDIFKFINMCLESNINVRVLNFNYNDILNLEIEENIEFTEQFALIIVLIIYKLLNN